MIYSVGNILRVVIYHCLIYFYVSHYWKNFTAIIIFLISNITLLGKLCIETSKIQSSFSFILRNSPSVPTHANLYSLIFFWKLLKQDVDIMCFQILHDCFICQIWSNDITVCMLQLLTLENKIMHCPQP